MSNYPLATNTWDNKELEAIQSVIDSDNYTMGNHVTQFENDFIKFLDHFKVDSIEYYGQTSQEFKNTIESFGFPVSYKKIISGYSK